MTALSGQKIKQILNKDKNEFDPLEINIENQEQVKVNGSIIKPDLILSVNFQEKSFDFICEVKSVTYPKNIKNAINHLQNYAQDLAKQNEYYPALIVPYITDTIYENIKDTGINAFDLNGNYYINIPNLLAIRLDKKNKYPEKRTIQNVFAGDSSIVCRYLLAYPKIYTMVKEIYEGIKSAGASIAFSTVSKVLKILEQEMIIYRDKNEIKLLQPDKLLKSLRDNYEPPNLKNSIKIKIEENELPHLLYQSLGNNNWIYSGTNSAFLYTTALKEKQYTVYTMANIFENKSLTKYKDKRFYNCEIIETDSKFAFFNSQNNYASKLQAYLELSRLDKREKEIAENIYHDIIREMENE